MNSPKETAKIIAAVAAAAEAAKNTPNAAQDAPKTGGDAFMTKQPDGSVTYSPTKFPTP